MMAMMHTCIVNKKNDVNTPTYIKFLTEYTVSGQETYCNRTVKLS